MPCILAARRGARNRKFGGRIWGRFYLLSGEPVTNDEFTNRLAIALHRPAFLPVPAFALKVVLGEMAEMLLASQRVLPTVAKSAGFRFQFPDLHSALENLFGA